MTLRLSTLLLASSLFAYPAFAQPPAPAAQAAPPSSGDLTTWPKGDSPQEIGKALAEKFAAMPLQGKDSINYPEVCAWYGSLTFAQLTHDDALRDKLVARFAPLLPGGAEASRFPTRHHVDSSMFGAVPLELSIVTHDLPSANPEYLKMGLTIADRQWTSEPGIDYPSAALSAPNLNGLSPETRYWVDDMYMLTMLQLEAYRATHDHKYLDRDAKEMVSYLDKLQQPNGLFFHAPDVPFFWGRGDGWFAAGMAEMLRSLPADHPDRPRILAGYKLMMSALLKYQGPDGMWHELIDHPEAWPETSSSAMFTFAMITGVKHGWLDAPTYAPVARKAWIAVTGYIDQNHDVTQVCEGTNKLNSYDYYLARKRRTGDLHGQAPILWAASALLRDEK
ncbi:MAG TPA: glycoside hydrolase family 88 protein [Acidobacteriaceae bacterium]|nr:glycoside hydrolase family 88 protein [Acidobacteriaceae bacterium]